MSDRADLGMEGGLPVDTATTSVAPVCQRLDERKAGWKQVRMPACLTQVEDERGRFLGRPAMLLVIITHCLAMHKMGRLLTAIALCLG